MTGLENKRVIIATHVYTTGPAQDLRDYLLQNKVSKLLFIGHPLFYDKKLKGSGYEWYEKGNLKKEKYAKIKKIPSVLSYIKDLMLNIWLIIIIKGKWDLYFGSDNLNALSGIILRYFGKVNEVIYYVIDYNPKRFKNKLLNSIYHRIDHFCVSQSDETWNLSPRMEEARKKYFGFSSGKQKVVPLGIWFDRIRKNNSIPSREHTLVFMGHITEKQGIQHVLAAVPLILEQIPDFKFLVIGGGNHLDLLKKQADNLKIAEHIEFSGFIEKQEDLEKLMARGSVAIAMYEKYDVDGNLSFTYFADPGKIKSYLASGLPVLLSDVSYNAREIAGQKCGLVIKNKKEKIAESTVALMQDIDTLSFYQRNAIKYSKNFNWDDIFNAALNMSNKKQ